jgi:DMSO reductase family type II enzyme chaperone
MPTPSETTPPVEWAARPDKPARSVFGNFRAEPLPAFTPAGDEPPAGKNRLAALSPAAVEAAAATTLQSSIDTALARSFLYRYLAKAFEDPTRDGWLWLVNSLTQTAVWSAAKSLDAAAHAPLLNAADALLAKLQPNQFAAFEDDYDAAFGHAARGRCPLNEIEYGDLKADPLFQPHRLADLAAFYRAFGLEVTGDAAERHDHICLELEFMSVLAAKDAFALEHQLDEEQSSLGCDAQKKFLREHLGRWTPAFTRRLARQAGDGALGALAQFTRAFLAADCARFGVTPGSEDLLLRPVDETTESLCASCGVTNLPPGALAAT